jgi:hypothetical protein
MNYWADKSSFLGKLIRPFFFDPFSGLFGEFSGAYRELTGTSKGLTRDLEGIFPLSGPCEVPVISLPGPC